MLVLDEPESNLDFKNQLIILETIQKLSKNRGISAIVNTHYPEHALKISDKALLLNQDGTNIFGDAAEVINVENMRHSFSSAQVHINQFSVDGREYRSVCSRSISCEVSSMKMITVAGAHACGKTSVILKTAELLLKENCRPGVMKLDCVSSEDDRIYSAAGITNVKHVSGNICPDHYFADSILGYLPVGPERKAGSSDHGERRPRRPMFSSHIRDISAVCVYRLPLRHHPAPQKIGPHACGTRTSSP